MSGFKSLLNKHLSNLVPEPAAWNEQYSPRVKVGRVSQPQRGRRGTEARSDLPEVTPSVGAGTMAHSSWPQTGGRGRGTAWSTKRKEDRWLFSSVALQDKPGNIE